MPAPLDGLSIHRPAALRRRQAASGWRDWLVTMLHAIESRRRLAEMDPRMLRDIGISRADALQEAARAPWDIAPRRPWDFR